jgi:hypothetical protein
LKATNYGLIRANDVLITLPDDLPKVRLEFQVPFQIFNLSANTSVFFRVNVIQGQEKFVSVKGSGGGCFFGILLGNYCFFYARFMLTPIIVLG